MAGNAQILPKVAETILALGLNPEDAAAAQLARRYAAAIDSAVDPAGTLNELGPKLLAVLEALGATPRARAAVAKGAASTGSGKLSALRLARQS